VSRVEYLSYAYEEKNPAYGQGLIPLEFKQCKSITCGDSCNTYDFTMNNHLGTHIDAPAHFFNEGQSISQIDPNKLCFDHPALVDIEIEEGTYLVCPKHLKGNIDPNIDLLIIRTGSYKKRQEDVYCKEGFGMSAELGEFLRENFKNLRAILLDTVSLSSFQNREEGRRSHKVFLNPESPLFIIEDADLSILEEVDVPDRVIVAPLLLGFADSAPCTVMGFWNGPEV
jgi:kynurenine formamidase